MSAATSAEMSAGSSAPAAVSAATSPPFPPSGGYIRAVRESAHALRVASGVKISSAAIDRLLRAPAFTTTFPRLAQSHGLRLPLAFASRGAELNVLAALALLNFGSGRRAALHAHAGRGAWDAVRALVLALHITPEGDPLSARGMAAATPARVAALMGLPTHVERPHARLPGVVVGEPGGPLYELCVLLAGVLSGTGALLVAQGYPDLGSFVLEALREGARVGRARGGGVDADVVLEKLVRAFPAFQDMSVVGGQPIYVFKKALFLLHAVYHRFGEQGGGDAAGAIPVPDASGLPIFADNVIPSMLVHLGVIDLSAATSPALAGAFQPAGDVAALLALPPPPSAGDTAGLPTDGPVLTQDDAYTLRAAAIDACEQMVAAAHAASATEGAWLGEVTLPGLDAWLWAGAKDRADYRALGRFVLRDTVFF